MCFVRFLMRSFLLCCAVCCLSLAPHLSREAGAEDAVLTRSIEAGSRYLAEIGQAEDGSFSAEAGPAVTALAVTGLLRTGTPADAEVVRRAIDYLLSFTQPSGGIHPADSRYANYETAIAVMALVACNTDGRYDEAVKKAEAFLKGLQWDGGESIEPSDPAYGGAGYGSKQRPDLSNTAFLIEALRAAGVGEDDPAIQRALVFVSRTQNLEGPANTMPFAAKNPDGGFYYTPANGGESQAGETPNGGLRSYASMTYAGLKSMIFAGLDREDPRVQAAVEWLRKHYTFEENPGMGDAGLYYFYQTAAKALDVLGDEVFVDADGREHRWREELVAELASRQQEDGSWINENSRWLEGDPNLVTAYALLALAACQD
jgi:squalene-hopene/tetraprenyl-beta-curcumene cyclase